MSLENPVRALNAEVARKIAAGEVIDRPNAIIRELMDNAIDSGAQDITVEICGGGIDRIRIVDNGCGMTKEDLQNCARPHATSKISTEEDLLKLSTLGFRGEALASIAAVSRLTIISGSWQMKASITEDHILSPCTEREGTIVQVEGVFENFPARRQFLKRPATEALMCKNTFIEKALANPAIAFKFIQDGETKLNLPKNQNIKERFVSATSAELQSDLFYTIVRTESSQNPEWKINIVIGEPAVSRTNKKDIQIFVNKRKIQEYSLVQAVEYGGQGFFPNGTYPVCAVFAEVRSDLVDFNIHPAKKEARFSDIASLHHAISSSIKEFLLRYTQQNFAEGKTTDEVRSEEVYEAGEKAFSAGNSFGSKAFTTANEFSARENFSPRETSSSRENAFSAATRDTEDSPYRKHITYKTSSASMNVGDYRAKYFSSQNDIHNLAEQALGLQIENQEPKEAEITKSSFQQKMTSPTQIRFIGFCLGTFLLAEKNNSLYIIDQHAVHERILFDNLMDNQHESKTQELLIPYKIETESKKQDEQLEELKPRLDKIGFKTRFVKDGLWEITAVPERWTGTEFELKSLILEKQVEVEQIIRKIAAMTACKAAIKDGYMIDETTAEELVKTAFTLEDPHSPHGRPIYTVFSREKLFELVKRT